MSPRTPSTSLGRVARDLDEPIRITKDSPISINQKVASAIDLTCHIDQILIPTLIRIRGSVPENPMLTKANNEGLEIPLVDQLNYLITRLEIIKDEVIELERLI